MSWRTSDGRIERLTVFAEIGGRPVPAGELVFEGRVRRVGRFAYARSWIEARRPPLVPVDLPVRTSASSGAPHDAPLAFYDAIPDGWGQAILRRSFPAQAFGIGEYLAACGDDRTGFLRCGPAPDAPERWFPEGPTAMALAEGDEGLDDLVAAALAADRDEASPSQLRALFRASADVGGARPKARVRHQGRDWIVKLPALGDAYDEPRLEAVCLDLAKNCWIETPAFRLENIAGRSALLVERFDRIDGRRRAYMSAATLLRQPPNDYRTEASYADIAATARRAGIEPCALALFHRMIFNAFVNNTDDHLRNHGFVADPAEGMLWRLSPVFDVVPNRMRTLVLRAAPGTPPSANPAELFTAHADFDLKRADAEAVYDTVVDRLQELPDVLDRHEVTAADRATWRSLAPHLWAPPRLPPKTSTKAKATARRPGKRHRS
jgi:serine/threonine-protein kinase HipA